jgi:hypothetical protein
MPISTPLTSNSPPTITSGYTSENVGNDRSNQNQLTKQVVTAVRHRVNRVLTDTVASIRKAGPSSLLHLGPVEMRILDDPEHVPERVEDGRGLDAAADVHDVVAHLGPEFQ